MICFALMANERTVTEMSRWVDAEWIKDRNSFVPRGELHTVEEFMQILDEAPTADVVEVVRCKDCRFGRKVCGNIECSFNITEYHGYNWFCPSGERKDGGA